MIDQLAWWQWTVIALLVSVVAIPWVYGAAHAVVRGYRAYLQLVFAICGVDPVDPPPKIVARYDDEEDVYRTENGLVFAPRDVAADGGRQEVEE